VGPITDRNEGGGWLNKGGGWNWGEGNDLTDINPWRQRPPIKGCEVGRRERARGTKEKFLDWGKLDTVARREPWGLLKLRTLCQRGGAYSTHLWGGGRSSRSNDLRWRKIGKRNKNSNCKS